MVSNQTAAISPANRAEAVGKIVGVAKKNKLVTAGIYSSSQSAEAIINSKGLSVYHRQTSAEVSITMLAQSSSGWQKANSPDVKNVDPVQLAEIAAQKARDSQSPRELPPGKYTVILEPAERLTWWALCSGTLAGWRFGPAVVPEQPHWDRVSLAKTLPSSMMLPIRFSRMLPLMVKAYTGAA